MTDAEPAGADEGVAGKRILVVEDEMIIAMLIEDILTDMGATVVGPAARVARAMDLLGTEDVDAALLDVNLAGETTTAVAEELRRRGIPFAFATGYGVSGLPAGFSGQPFLQKPFQERDLSQVMAQVLA
ncbi:response regulator [Rubellimicrobium aerolatum]|uniref:Response regulator n=1 Tax=Rubellimicrobium aerolatum TaxID=490979 RepID=A0ABW0SCR4_9RHOB|nr:response regulator [Rubellimicrobium aerolatum]MBP1806568.1 CheY-like chemotaxis protein [Rubellimicrobium aerolatum]